MEYNKVLKLRPGTQHQLADAMLRLHRCKVRGADVNDSFPGDWSNRQAFRGHQGSVLDGIPLSKMVVEAIGNSVTTRLSNVGVLTASCCLYTRV